jgi:hypothetical protein
MENENCVYTKADLRVPPATPGKHPKLKNNQLLRFGQPNIQIKPSNRKKEFSVPLKHPSYPMFLVFGAILPPFQNDNATLMGKLIRQLLTA